MICFTFPVIHWNIPFFTFFLKGFHDSAIITNRWRVSVISVPMGVSCSVMHYTHLPSLTHIFFMVYMIQCLYQLLMIDRKLRADGCCLYQAALHAPSLSHPSLSTIRLIWFRGPYTNRWWSIANSVPMDVTFTECHYTHHPSLTFFY